MSLDIYLYTDEAQKKQQSSGIFVREDGQIKEISRKEWDKRFPGQEPCIFVDNEEETTCVFRVNITHNLNNMADKAKLYLVMWRPEEVDITKASQAIAPLKNGLKELKKDPTYYRQFNPSNGWGSYEVLVDVVEKYLEACKKYPEATIYVSR